MKHKRSKLLALLLIFCTLLTSVFLPSCGGADTDKEGADDTAVAGDIKDAATTVTETTQLRPDLPDIDFDGRTYDMLVMDNDNAWWLENFEYYAELNGEVLNDAIYMRNNAVEERFNFKITETREANPGAIMRTSITAGESQYEVFCEDLAELANFASSGYLYDFNSIPYIDLGMPWWDANAASGFSLGGSLYFMTGDYTLHDKYRLYCILFNKGLAEKYNVENLYNVVDDNRWTIDLMEKIARETTVDLDGDGVIGYADQWGILSQAYDNFNGMCYGMDNRISTKDKDDMPVIDMYTDRLVKTVDILVNFLCDTNVSLFMQDIKGQPRADIFMATMYESGQAIFYNALLVCAKMTYQNTDQLDFGIIPQPKLDESQENYLTTTQYPWAYGIAVPLTVEDAEFTGIALEALSAESRYVTMPAFYEVTIKTKYTTDEKAPVMLDMIFDNIIYDVAAVYNWGGLRTILDATLPQRKENIFASEYAKAEAKIEADMQKTLEAFFG
ncbi:MAG: hypothetical protein GX628_00625 [Clostridiales bacterium]|nr:hypothetical protein [Clostridiales bacterium]